MDPPWQLATANPTRGVALGYSQVPIPQVVLLALLQPTLMLQLHALLVYGLLSSGPARCPSCCLAATTSLLQLTDAHIAALPIPRLQKNGLLFVWVRAVLWASLLHGGRQLQHTIQLHVEQLLAVPAAAGRHCPSLGSRAFGSPVWQPSGPNAAHATCIVQVINAKYQFCLDLFDQWGYE